VAIPAVAVAAWQHDEQSHKNRVARATTVAGINVSGANADSLHTSLLSLQQHLQSSPIEIGHEQQRFTAQTSEFDLDLDVDATQDAVLGTSHDGTAVTRFGRWVRAHFQKNAAPVVVTFNSDKLANVISTKDPGPRTQPTNPTIAFENNEFVIVKGADGHGLVNTEAPSAIRSAVKNGFPLNAQVSTGDIPAISNPDDLQTVIRDAKAVTETPLNVTAEGKTATVSAEQLRPLMTATPSGDHLRLDLDNAATIKRLQQLLAGAGHKAIEAGYTVVDNKPQKIDGKSGTTCCGDESPSIIRDALLQRLTGGDPNAPVALPMKIVNPKTTSADVPDLGINEEIASFTTHHPAGQPRVKNIHLIADLTRGTVVKPGETFSINNAVGERTLEKGFVVDHVIEDGKFAESVGGGISQYATTLFNAAFFGGLDFGEYQSHSIYIDRYPYGREATVSFPHPDMQVKNKTPYGVLIWPTYTDTSLTVTLYSTKYATGAQTAQTTQPVGKCTRVRTERTRTYVDGHNAVDTVSALYQPKEGEKC
jgi:vancomycin resistance protein YoaR